MCNIYVIYNNYIIFYIFEVNLISYFFIEEKRIKTFVPWLYRDKKTWEEKARRDAKSSRIRGYSLKRFLFSGAAANEILFEFHVSIIHYRVTMGEHCGHHGDSVRISSIRAYRIYEGL